MFSIDGLVSGLDTTSIIEGLVSLQSAQVDRLNVKKSVILNEQTAFQGIEARLLGLRSTMGRLNRSTGSVFDSSAATSSDESNLVAKAGSNAAEGSYSIRVNSLAKAHQVGSEGFDSTSASITQGTISFKVGDRPATEITIDESNNTVSGLVDAINSQSEDISASIVHDQANNADRILLTSRHTGASNQIEITNNLGASSGSETRPDFSGLAVQEASNAVVQLGSGPGAIVAEYDTNSVEGLIENVTLDLSIADPDKDITVNVTKDTEPALSAIQGFVEDYNALIGYIDEQTQYNGETNSASPLLGNRNVSTLKNKLGAMVTETVPGLDSTLNRFSQIGIDIDGKGKLSVDSAQLNKALDGDLDGIDSGDIKKLFGLSATSSNSNIQFVLGSTRTEASTSNYEVDILQAAEKASVIANGTLGNSVTIDDTNNQFQISIDGQESEVLTLDNGTYSQTEVAQHLQSLINASSNLSGRSVSVSMEGNSLEITSDSYGLSSEIGGISGSAIASLGFDGAENDQGQDVVGNFIVDGVIEAATGSGRILIGDSENTNTADLQVRVTLDQSQVGTGIEGDLAVSRGISSRLDKYFGDILNPDTGTIKIANDDFDLRVESLESSIERVNEISEAKTQSLIEQFAQLERVLGGLQSTSSFLTSQLAAL
ncbi:MAG: flagellar filament capping protein FliD [Mariniblastus sp.]